MGFRERTVTGSLVDADGSPIATAQLSFQLDKPLGYTSTHVVINRIFNATTDAAGLFSITLWCDEDSLLALDYTVSFPTANAGLPQNTHTAKISLAYQDGSAKDIGTLIAESQPPPTSVPEATWRLLIEDEIAMTPITREIGLAASDETTDLTTGTAKVTFRIPYAFTITGVRASVNTAPTGSTIIVDINKNGTTIMATNKLSIDATEKTSVTAATAAGVTTTSLSNDDEITIDIDQVGSTVPGKGLKVWLIGHK
jgi:hypothetical protein